MKIWLKNLNIHNPNVLTQISNDWTQKKTTYSNIFFSSKGLIKLKNNKLYPLIPTFNSAKTMDNDHIICDNIEWKLQKEIYQLPPQHIMTTIKKTLYKKKNINFDIIVEYFNEVIYDIYFIPNKPNISINNFTLCVNDFD